MAHTALIERVKRLPQKELSDFSQLWFRRICKDSMESKIAWTETTRRNYVRRTLRLGRPRQTDLRGVVNALLYIAPTGCQWRMLPKDFPPCSTVQRYFYEWRAIGLWPRINHHLVMEARALTARQSAGRGAARRGRW